MLLAEPRWSGAGLGECGHPARGECDGEAAGHGLPRQPQRRQEHARRLRAQGTFEWTVECKHCLLNRDMED